MSDPDLARRLVACPRWKPRELGNPYLIDNGRLTSRERGTGRLWVDVSPRGADNYDWLPDLDDAATVGCLLALVRGVYNWRGLHVRPLYSIHTGEVRGWRVDVGEDVWADGPTAIRRPRRGAGGSIMRDPARIDPLMDFIRKVMHANPDLRLAQIVCIGANVIGTPWHVEDDDLLANLKRHFPEVKP